MHNKKLFFFLPNFSKGGAGESVSKLILDLSKHSIECRVICLGKCHYKKLLIKKNIKIFELKNSSTFFAMPKIKKILKDEKEINKKNIFISNINYANVLSILFLRSISNLKIILFERTPIQELNYNFGSFNKFIKNSVIKFLIKFTYKYADAIVCNNRITSKDFKLFLNKKIFTIYSKSIDKIYTLKKIKKSKFIKILWVGRFTNEKNFSCMIHAANILKKQNILIYVLGSGENKLKYLSIIKNYGISNKFKFFGFKKNIEFYYRKCELFVSTSFYEGFPNSMIRAINFGLPVISSRSYGGANEILKKNKYGTFYENNDYKSLSKQILLYNRNKKQFQRKAKLAHQSLKKFKFSEISNNFLKLIKKV